MERDKFEVKGVGDSLQIPSFLYFRWAAELIGASSVVSGEAIGFYLISNKNILYKMQENVV